jgi:hypothetical protein
MLWYVVRGEKKEFGVVHSAKREPALSDEYWAFE